MAFDNSGTNAVWATRLWTPQKVWTTTFLHRNSIGHTSLDSSLFRTLKNAISAGLAERLKKLRLLPEHLEKFRLTELHEAPPEGPTNFLYRSSLGGTSMDSCRLAELKYAIFSRTARKPKKLRRSKDEKITALNVTALKIRKNWRQGKDAACSLLDPQNA